jgi:hypothetical protein
MRSREPEIDSNAVIERLEVRGDGSLGEENRKTAVEWSILDIFGNNKT